MLGWMEPTDEELLIAWRGGDREASGVLFDRYITSIGRFLRTKVGDDYEELLQQTFERCVEGQHRFRGEGTFRSYLFSIAGNVVREYLRRDHAKDMEELSSVVDLNMPGPSTVAGARRENLILLQALRRIPIDDQIIFELFYWEPMNSAEIAEVLGIPRGTVRSRLRLAKERLRGHFEQLARNPAEFESTDGGLERWAAELRDMLR